MSPLSRSAFETFEQLCHEVSNPLMVVSGHTHLLERYVLHLAGLSNGERDQLLVELASIKGHVRAAVLLMEQERWRLTGDNESHHDS
jgi:nitrogen-specific signal transduction histidine kinase